jgi:hypothetical protein
MIAETVEHRPRRGHRDLLVEDRLAQNDEVIPPRGERARPTWSTTWAMRGVLARR